MFNISHIYSIFESMSATSSAMLKIQDAAIRLFAEWGPREVSISDLADAAGVARGTIYNNVSDPQALFDEVASRVLHDMHLRVASSMKQVDDPAQRLAHGTRQFIRHAHEEPSWGRFMVRFAINDDSMRRMLDEPPSVDIRRGMETGRFHITPDMLPSVLSLVGGSSLAAMQSVLVGRQTWREAGQHTAELILKALGLDATEAHTLACIELPSLITINTSSRRSRNR